MKHKTIYWVLPLIGAVFCLWYISASTCDVIYSDYVRLINSYLPDVWDLKKFLVADVLTRIPVNYLSRIINVSFFGFSTTFDMVLGVGGLCLAGLVLGRYSSKKSIGWFWFTLLMVVMFSLNKWEMLSNGSGWSHFLAFACFYYHYLVIDRVFEGGGKKYDRVRLVVLPFFITLGVAGPYCAIYSVTLILAYGFIMLLRYQKKGDWDLRYLLYMAAALIPLLLYLWSNSYAVEDHADAVTTPIWPVLMDTPSFFIRFFVKSFSSMVLGGEVAESMFSSNAPFFVLGSLVIGAYLLALWLNFKYRLYEKTIFPLILIISGGLNHVLILVSRWIFLQENYGISSRYALQFQVGILGIILTFGLVFKQAGRKKRYVIRALAAGFCIMFLAGNCYTTYREIKKVPNRRDIYETRVEVALNFEQESDDVIRKTFDYRKSQPGSVDKVRRALGILKEHNWSVYGGDSLNGGLKDESSDTGRRPGYQN